MSRGAQQPSALIGGVIAERYRLDAILGFGGTGIVYRALCVEDGTTVAVKTIRPELVSDKVIARFFRGARLAADLRHSGVVRTLAFGQSTGEIAVPYQVMEYISGVSMSVLAKDDLETGEAIGLVCQVLDALAYVHARGVIHRDIKPANIMLRLGVDGRVRCHLTDFGIAGVFQPRGQRDTAGAAPIQSAKALMGTPAYMAPEQALASEAVDPAVDLYPVGVILYHLLSGSRPFRGTSTEIMTAKITGEAPPLVCDDLDPVIAEVVSRLLAREPQDRYPLAPIARSALEPFAVPWQMTEEHMAKLVSRPLRARAREASVTFEWKAPGPETIHRAWPRLVVPQIEPMERRFLAGRSEVLRAIERVAEKVEGGQTRIVNLVGAAGMGKSAVIEQVVVGLLEQGRFMLLRAPFFEGGVRRGGLRLGIERALGAQGDDRAQVRAGIERFLSHYDDVSPEEAEHLLAFLRPDAESGVAGLRPEENMALMVRVLRRLARTRPMLVVFDDVDKGGADLAAFMEFLLQESRFDPLPLLVLSSMTEPTSDADFARVYLRTKRFEGMERRTLRLHPIPDDVLVAGLVARFGILHRDAVGIARRAGGNPLHATALIRSISSLDSTDVDRSLDTSLTALPAALLSALHHRLEGQLSQLEYPEPIREVLNAIAVLGDAVEEDLIAQFLPSEVGEWLDLHMERLLDIGVVGIADHGEPMVYELTPVLLREAILEPLSEADLADLHRRAIEVRMGLAHDRRRGHWGRMGDHHAARGDHASAASCWLKGMRYEAAAGDVMRAASWGQRALAQMADDAEDRGEVALLLGVLLLDSGDFEAAERVLRAVLDGADVDRALQAGDLLCDLLENAGRASEWVSAIEQMTAMEPRAGETGRCALYSARAMWLNTSGRRVEALETAQRALALAAPGPPAQRAAQRLAFTFIPNMQLVEAEAAARRSLEEASEVPLLQVRSLRTLGTVQAWRGKIEAAIKSHSSAAAISRRAGLLTRVPIAIHDLGDVYRSQGRNDAARAEYAEAIRLGTEMGMESGVALSRMQMCMCDLAEGSTESTLLNIDAYVEEAEAAGLFMSQPFGTLLRCWAHAIDGDLEPTLQAFESVGSLDGMGIDPQVPMGLTTIASQLVEMVNLFSSSPPEVNRVVAVCRDILVFLEEAGDEERQAHVKVLMRRIPRMPE